MSASVTGVLNSSLSNDYKLRCNCSVKVLVGFSLSFLLLLLLKSYRMFVFVCVFSVFARLPLMTLCSGLKPFMIHLVKIEFRCIKWRWLFRVSFKPNGNIVFIYLHTGFLLTEDKHYVCDMEVSIVSIASMREFRDSENKICLEEVE